MDTIAAHTMPQQDDEEAAETHAMISQALNVLNRLLSFKEHETDANSMNLT
ncbi:BgTH12-07620 [Blumeria graminis f. sp. triticale]|uniref:BgTH12-07620 n=1 Tax=Blumeria graminis f. sp. triticale TaxID=1689686 RepID=A0A9W4CXL8_BLUGR|nr:BgTH12-07620 [Blumeria graminis f. sp. triticale]